MVRFPRSVIREPLIRALTGHSVEANGDEAQQSRKASRSALLPILTGRRPQAVKSDRPAEAVAGHPCLP